MLVKMLRVLGLGSLLATVCVAMPAAAFDVQVRDCSSLVLAFTESDETHVDVYVSEVIGYHQDPSLVTNSYAKDRLAWLLHEGDDLLFDPGEVGRGEYVAMIEFQVSQHNDPDVTGVRFTYMVDVGACTGT